MLRNSRMTLYFVIVDLSFFLNRVQKLFIDFFKALIALKALASVALGA